MSRNVETLSLGIIKFRQNKEDALKAGQNYLNIKPSFQREYEAWDDKLKVKLIETILNGHIMNPIWTIHNEDEESDEVLDGLHRLSTALSFLNNEFALKKKYFSNLEEYYHGKKYDELSSKEKQKIKNYNFTFNKLDSSYHKDKNKLRDMYEILNRSSITLNDYEFNKIILKPFYEIFIEKKVNYLESNLFKNNRFVKDERGALESEMITFLILSYDLHPVWCSISSLKKQWIYQNLGDTIDEIESNVEENKDEYSFNVDLILDIVNEFDDKKLFNFTDKRDFKNKRLIYQFLISRSAYHFDNISGIKNISSDLVNDLKKNIVDVDIQEIMECKTRNAVFQKKLINKIDSILLSIKSK